MIGVVTVANDIDSKLADQVLSDVSLDEETVDATGFPEVPDTTMSELEDGINDPVESFVVSCDINWLTEVCADNSEGKDCT